MCIHTHDLQSSLPRSSADTSAASAPGSAAMHMHTLIAVVNL